MEPGLRGGRLHRRLPVEVLPEGVDPLDVRYNVVNWVDRATRGWSYGQGIVDPRTGEIVKGSVVLGSLRVRQDIQIFEGLVGADKDGTGGAERPGAGSARTPAPACGARGRSCAGLCAQFRGSARSAAPR